MVERPDWWEEAWALVNEWAADGKWDEIAEQVNRISDKAFTREVLLLVRQRSIIFGV